MEVVSIRQAEAAGLKHYFTGKPCKHGHLSPRYVSTTRCVECTVQRVITWQRRNPDKHAAKNARYYDAHPGKALEHSRNDHETARQRLERERTAIAGRPRPMVCDICQGPDPREKIVWDHCHTTGAFRGWLCDRCNKTIGAAEDSPRLLRQMADYLERHYGSADKEDPARRRDAVENQDQSVGESPLRSCAWASRTEPHASEGCGSPPAQDVA